MARPGDTDLDGDIDIFDVLNINTFLAGVFPSPMRVDADWKDGDFDDNDRVDIFDILLLNQSLVITGGLGNIYAATPGGQGDSPSASNTAAASVGMTVDAGGLARSRLADGTAWADSVDRVHGVTPNVS